MAENAHGPNPGVFAEYAALDDQQRASFFLGRLLQVLPDTSIETHMQHVTQAMDVLKPRGGINLDKHGGLASIFGFSQAIEDRYGRPRVLLSNLSGDEHTVFYRSTSHAVWRALLGSDYRGWIAKEMFGVENSTDAPWRLQKLLDKLADEEVARGEGLTDILFAIHNDRADLGSEPAVIKIAEGKMYTAGVAEAPTYDSGDIVSDDPDELFVASKVPLLDSPIDEWTRSHPMYETVTSTVYPSADGTLRYQVNAAQFEGRTQRWIGTAQVIGASITRLAIPREFVKIPEELLKPPIDYGEHTGNDYDERRQELSRFEVFALEAGLS